jgi:hypothetical protein
MLHCRCPALAGFLALIVFGVGAGVIVMVRRAGGKRSRSVSIVRIFINYLQVRAVHFELCVFVCACACVCVGMYRCVWVCVQRVRVYVWVFVCVCDGCVYVWVGVWVGVFVCAACVCVYVWVCKAVCVHV